MADVVGTVANWLGPQIQFEDDRQGLCGEFVSICSELFAAFLETFSDHNKNGPFYRKLRIEAQRFSLWSDSFEAKEGVLDVTVANSERLNETILTVFDDLGHHLAELIGKHINTQSREGREATFSMIELMQRFRVVCDRVDGALHKDEGEASSSESTTSSDSGPESSYAFSPDDPNALVGEITLCNDLLSDLVPALQNPIKDNPLERRERSKDYLQLSDENARPFVNMVLELFPSLDMKLAVRLGEVNWHRKQRLSKNLHHPHDFRLYKGERMIAKSIHTSDMISSSSALPIELKSSALSIFSDKDAPNKYKRLIYHVLASDDPFPDFSNACPICGDEGHNVGGRLCWHEHIMRDLGPYVCLDPDCMSPNQTFAEKQDWADHELFFHLDQTSQNCEICSENVQDLNALEVHLMKDHGKKKGNHQINSAVKSFKRSSLSTEKERVCPFCSTKLPKHKRAYIWHTAEHLVFIALSALPESMLGDTDSADDGDLFRDSVEGDLRKSRKTPRHEQYNPGRPAFSLGDHWISSLYQQALPETPLKMGFQRSACFGENLGPDACRRLADSYTKLLEVPFEAGHLRVSLYQRAKDLKTRVLCQVFQPHLSPKHCCLPLTALEIARDQRDGQLLKLVHKQNSGYVKEWAVLAFATFESLVIFYSTFVALRFEDYGSPVIIDSKYPMGGEQRLCTASIRDNGYEHSLELYKDEETGVIRFQASVLRGEMKRAPVWAAFITDQIDSPTWMTTVSQTVLSLKDLKLYTFIDDYQPQYTFDGAFKLHFLGSEHALRFVGKINGLKYKRTAKDAPRNSNIVKYLGPPSSVEED